MTGIHEMQKKKGAHYQQWQIHKCSVSHYDAKGQRLTEVTKVLVDFVNLVVTGKANTENSFGWGNKYIYINVYLACPIKM